MRGADALAIVIKSRSGRDGYRSRTTRHTERDREAGGTGLRSVHYWDTLQLRHSTTLLVSPSLSVSLSLCLSFYAWDWKPPTRVHTHDNQKPGLTDKMTITYLGQSSAQALDTDLMSPKYGYTIDQAGSKFTPIQSPKSWQRRQDVHVRSLLIDWFYLFTTWPLRSRSLLQIMIDNDNGGCYY